MRNRIVIMVALMGVAPIATAEEYTLGTLTISDPWATELDDREAQGAAYMTIINSGDSPHHMIAAGALVADRVAIYAPSEGREPAVAAEIEIPAGSKVELAPDGPALRLVDLKLPLEEGERFPITLGFAELGSVEIYFDIRDGVSDPSEAIAEDDLGDYVPDFEPD